MIPGYATVMAASANDRRDLFIGAGNRLGTVQQNIEKDFWVCWTLDALFNGSQAGGPRLLFKGGTSLSKAYGLIARFSEDIDITVFRDDIGQAATVEELEALSGKKRAARLDAIREACQNYINGPLLEQLSRLLRGLLQTANQAPELGRVEADPDDPDHQSLLLWYPTVTADGANYVRRAVKIEAGAKSALDPHAARTVTPYVAQDLADTDLAVPNITTVDPRRTFWDKVAILHGLRRWWDRRGELRGGGQRVSRHYYDVHRLLTSDDGQNLARDAAMAADCVRHARMFFNRPDFDLATAAPGSYALVPHNGMLANLEQDYNAMSQMIFGEVPAFSAIIDSIVTLERRLNR
ncbi:MAG: nucleotidyl transferase AbiEii/AbiGii toxin family protein [Candidatus Sulfotelmatobacter sp.]